MAGKRHQRRSQKRTRKATAANDLAALVHAAQTAHQAGRLDEAIAHYEVVLARRPREASLRHLCGLALLQRGDAARGHEEIGIAIREDDSVAEYHLNYGAACEALDDLDGAAKAYAHAIGLTPDDADVHFNLGLVHLRQSTFDLAVRHFERAVAIAPNDAEAWENLGRAHLGDGAFGAARDALERALPERGPSARALLGDVALGEQNFDHAIACYREALSAQREAGWLTNLGNAWRGKGDHTKARQAYEQALALEPQLAQPRFNLGTLAEETGDAAGALVHLRDAYQRGVDEAAPRLAGVLARAFPETSDPALQRVLVALFQTEGVDRQSLAASAAAQIRAKWGRSPHGPGAADPMAVDWLHDELTGALLTHAINVDPALERDLIAARSHLASRIEQWDDRAREAAALLAIQCFSNEYAWAGTINDVDSDDSSAATSELDRWLAAGLFAAPDLDAQAPIRRHALPMTRLWLQRAWEEPRVERELAAAMPTWGELGDDATTTAVRAQYEANPYPRWIDAPAATGSLMASLDARFESVDVAALSANGLRILVGGCGTGQDPIRLARAHPDASVLAVDLSRRALAYGERMANALGIRSIQFRQADLMTLSGTDARFDLISSTGVLHHMADPVGGLASLLSVLVRGGVARVGLYSRLARAPIDVACAYVQARGFGGEHLADIQAFRRAVLNADADGLEFLLDSEDFYSASACRDLVFHVHEISYDLEQLADILVKLPCEFLGFDIDDPTVLMQFGKEYPDRLADLAAWNSFERSYPATFRGMYQFWLRKTE
ncbi:MAG: tetratricopeptide repeat protein [Pseudomonadota bacterium]